MFKIGDFSRLTQVTVKTLRYYDDIGLLKPGRVDHFTGYRYYSVDQLPRLNRILALKEMDLSLEQIARLLDDGLPASEVRGMLRLKQAELRQRVEEERGRLTRVEARLSLIEQEGTMPDYEVVIKKVEPQTVAALREVIPTYGDVGRLFDRVCGPLVRQGARFAGPAMAVYYDPEYREHDVDVEVAVPVLGSTQVPAEVRLKELPGYETVASVIHQGPYEEFSRSYGVLMGWIESNGYQIAGPNREIYIKGPGDTGEPASYVTEIQIPVAKGS